MVSFAVIIVAVNEAIDYFSFVTIEKKMMEKADLSELSFREVLARHAASADSSDASGVARSALETLKAAGQEVRIYDNQLTLVGLAVDGIVISDGTPVIFRDNLENALAGNYAYSVAGNHKLYFSIPIQDQYYENAYIFEFVEDISYFYEIMDRVRYILLAGAGGFLLLITLSSLYVARTTTKPIKYLLGATESFSRQEFRPVTLNRKDELGMLADGLNRMGMQLSDYIEYQKQFVSNVSHELKTPLAAIRGFSQYLYEGESRDKELQKIYSHLLNESDRLTKLINELLLLSRFDKASPEELEATDVSVLAAKVEARMSGMAADKRIVLETKLEEGVFAEVNPILMTQAISNLVDNAVKYSGAGTSVSLETLVSGNRVVIRVSDQGIGIGPHDLTRVQERFYRSGNSQLAKGSGLGLSICKEITEKCNGHLELESELGKGTTVSIVLPYRMLQD